MNQRVKEVNKSRIIYIETAKSRMEEEDIFLFFNNLQLKKKEIILVI